MVHKVVLKVDISCDRCKQEVLSIVSSLEGVNKMETDSEKDTLTIIGEADPYAIITCLRKAGKKAQFVTVGPPDKPKEPEKKPDPPKCICGAPCSYPYPYSCMCKEKAKEKEKEKEKEKKPDPPKCKCPAPCSCPVPYPYPYPYPYAYPCPSPYSYPSKGRGLVCEPIALMTTDYQDPPPPPCSIM